jgi:hypothetical protein
MTKLLFGQAVLACLLMMGGCAGGNGSGNRFGLGVQAAGFSNSTLTGTYALSGQSTGFVSQGSKKIERVGFVTLDGKGGIASGAMTEASEQAASVCTFSLSGTYSVSANGTGTATIMASTTAGSCVDETSTFAFALSNGGSLVNLVDTTVGSGAITSDVLYRQ